LELAARWRCAAASEALRRELGREPEKQEERAGEVRAALETLEGESIGEEDVRTERSTAGRALQWRNGDGGCVLAQGKKRADTMEGNRSSWKAPRYL
jgi:hypothetical protein